MAEKMQLSYIFKLLLLLCAFIWMCSACNYTVKKPFDVGDGGLLSGKPCSAPCFHYIIPGVTTEKKTLRMLSGELNIKDCDHWDKDTSGVDKGIKCQNFGITFNDLGVVNTISFGPSQIITIDEIVKKFGAPDGVGISILGIEMQPPIAMRLYFNEENMIVFLSEQNNNTYNLEQNTRVENVGYFEQSEYIISKNSAQEWKGFGEYSYK